MIIQAGPQEKCALFDLRSPYPHFPNSLVHAVLSDCVVFVLA